MIAVGIDISKGKSTVAILDGDGSIRVHPYEMNHSKAELDALIKYIKAVDDHPIILMEPTGHYHHPVLKAFLDAGLSPSLVNPYLLKKYGDAELRKAKTDKKDAMRIARYALEKWYSLVPYSPMDQKYADLRFLSSQYRQRISMVTKSKVQLINLLDESMPGITKILALKSRNPEKCMLLQFIKRFHSFDYINSIGKTRFMNSYTTLARKVGERNAAAKGLAIYELSKASITTRSNSDYMDIALDQCVDILSDSQRAADEIMLQMQNIAETIPEYKVLLSMNGVGDRLGPVILAEIGDIRRFHSGKALNAYAGNDAPPYQSGQFESRSRHISKRGNPALRKACFEVMQALKLTKPQDDPVYLFMMKKEQEGKPYNVAKMAAVNKFLRIYYARAMELYK
jgi:transposase